jgi:colanic acid biosynthesis glycosyl transferase WcaI
MNILLISLNYKPEEIGVGKFSGELVDELIEFGHSIDVITTYPFYPDWEISPINSNPYIYSTAKTKNLKIHRCPIYVPKKITIFRRLLHYLSFAVSIVPVLICKINKKYDYVYLVLPSIIALPIVILYAKLKKIRLAVHVQDLEIAATIDAFKLKKTKIIGIVEKWLIEKSDILITISHDMRQYFIGYENVKTLIVRNWVDLKKFELKLDHELILNKFKLKKEEFIILYSGSIGWKQASDILIRVSEKLRKDKNFSYRIIICGDGPEKKKLQSISGDDEKIIWMEVLDEKLFCELMCVADVHLITQKREMTKYLMPSKLTSIFASGRPVIAQTDGGTELEYMVKDAGLVVKIGDVDEMTNAILKMKDDIELRRIYGKNAKMKARKYYDKDKVLSELNSELTGFKNK